MEEFNLFIGSVGFSGAVLAERIATQPHKTGLIIGPRKRVGGDAYDRYENGVPLDNYGMHYFRAHSQRIVEYLNQFAQWWEVGSKTKAAQRQGTRSKGSPRDSDPHQSLRARLE